jgi:hypothetical protein
MLGEIFIMKKQEFTREEVINLIEKLLQDPDVLMDAVQNENTDWDAEKLLEKAEE